MLNGKSLLPSWRSDRQQHEVWHWSSITTIALKLHSAVYHTYIWQQHLSNYYHNNAYDKLEARQLMRHGLVSSQYVDVCQ